jgi:hypothetical protein
MIKAAIAGASLVVSTALVPSSLATAAEMPGPTLACSRVNVIGPGRGQYPAIPPYLSETEPQDSPQWRSVFFGRGDSTVVISFDSSCQRPNGTSWDTDVEAWSKSQAQVRLSSPTGAVVTETMSASGGLFEPDGYWFRSPPLGELLLSVSPQQRVDLSYRLRDGKTAEWTAWTDVQPQQPSWGPIQLEGMNSELSAPIVSVTEQVGALDVSWSLPVVRPIMSGPNTDRLSYGISWYRDGRKVGSSGTSWWEREPTSQLLDGLTMTQRYRVCVSASMPVQGYVPIFLSPQGCASGTALLPASLRLMAPATVRVNTATRVGIRTTSKGKRHVRGTVRLFFVRKSGKSRSLRSLSLNRLGKAKTTLRFKKSGKLRAALKPTGPFPVVEQERRIRVRKGAR